MKQHYLPQTRVNSPPQALLSTLALSAFGISAQAKQIDVHAATPALRDGDPNYYTNLNLLTEVDARHLATSAGITNTGPVLVSTLPIKKAIRRAGAVKATFHGQRQVSSVHGRYTLN